MNETTDRSIRLGAVGVAVCGIAIFVLGIGKQGQARELFIADAISGLALAAGLVLSSGSGRRRAVYGGVLAVVGAIGVATFGFLVRLRGYL